MIGSGWKKERERIEGDERKVVIRGYTYTFQAPEHEYGIN